jgi:hypothetical protein
MFDGPAYCRWGTAGISDATATSATLWESRAPEHPFPVCVFVGGIMGHPSHCAFEVGTMVDEYNELSNLGSSAPRLTAVSGRVGELRMGHTRA